LSLANLNKEIYCYELIKQRKILVNAKKGKVKVIGGYKEIYKSNDENEYVYVPFKYNDKFYTILLHRVIWISKNGLIKDKRLQINHIDGVKGHCWISNLELVTNAQNIKHAYDTGLNKVSDNARKLSSERLIGSKNINSKFTDKELFISEKSLIKTKCQLKIFLKRKKEKFLLKQLKI